MTPEEIVRRLRGRRCMTMDEAADLIEQQASALEKAEKALIPFANCNEHWGTITIGDLRRSELALATIRAARGEMEDG